MVRYRYSSPFEPDDGGNIGLLVGIGSGGVPTAEVIGSGRRRSRSVVEVAGVVERLAVDGGLEGYPLDVGGMDGRVLELPDAERVRSNRSAAFSLAVDGGVIAGVMDIGVAAEEPRRGLEEEREKSLGMRPRPRVDVGPWWWCE